MSETSISDTMQPVTQSRIRRRINPTPKPTKATRTNMRISGLLVMAVANSCTHLIASVTIAVASVRITDTVGDDVVQIPPFKDVSYGEKENTLQITGTSP